MNYSKKHLKRIARELHKAMNYYGDFSLVYLTTAHHYSNTKSYGRW